MSSALKSTTPTLDRFASVARMMGYTLPGDMDDRHVIGVSGGADSSALAILMHRIFPEAEFQYLFTDTQAEVQGTNEALARIEAYTGRTIEWVAQKDGLWGLIENFGNYLPSGGSRYCTRILKTEPTEDWLETLRGDRDIKIHNYAGLRADEQSRSGLDSSMPWLVTHLPLRDLGLNREHVFAILDETVGVPSFYRFRSRSGCGSCFFSRSSEMLATLENAPEDFRKAESVECLSETDQQRYAIAGNDLSGQRMAYPIPSFVDIRTAPDFPEDEITVPLRKSRNNTIVDMFSSQNTDLYVGIEYLTDPMMAMFGGDATGTPGVWHSALVSWSTTRGGLSRKLTTQYHTRLDACEVFGLKQTDFIEQYGLAIYHVELPADRIDLGGTTQGTYSWRRDEPLAKLRQIASAVKHLMAVENLKAACKDYQAFADTPSWEGEQYEYATTRLEAIDEEESGQLLGVYRFQPGKRAAPATGDNAPCFVCSK